MLQKIIESLTHSGKEIILIIGHHIATSYKYFIENVYSIHIIYC